MNKCKTCKFYTPTQSELNYINYVGFCINPTFKFNTTSGRIVGVYDRKNEKSRETVPGNPSHDFESKEGLKIFNSRYSLQVSDDFGCIFHEQTELK